MSNVPTFSDPKLQEVANRVWPIISGWQAKIDRISKHILSAEKYLRAEGIAEPLAIVIGDRALRWDFYGPRGLRLQYMKNNLGKPLVEWAVEDRLEGYKLLPDLIKQAKRYKEIQNG